MKQTLILFPFFLMTILVGHTQENKPNDFIPEGYTEFSKQFEDLNNDGQDDCILIIKKVDSTNVVINRFDQKVRNRRGIIVLFKMKELWAAFKIIPALHQKMKMVAYTLRPSYP